jgi:large subunit ribosomal protein L9
MAKVKVVLTERVQGVGEPGDVATVAGGFARNFLLPRKLAVAATKGNVAQADSWRRSRTNRSRKEVVAAAELRKRVEAGPLRIKAQAGPDGRLFGSVTAAAVAQSLKDSLGLEVDRHDVHVDEPIRHLGFHEVRVRLHADVSAKLTLEVVET